MAANLTEDFSRYDRKLEFILRTSARIFAAKSFHSTSMRDISKATGVSLAGLYHYCKSKEELLFLIQDNCFGRVLGRLEERLGRYETPTDKLRVFIENHLAFFAANMAEMKVLSHESDSLRGEMHDRVSAKKESYTRLAREILSEIQLGARRDTKQIDLTVATYSLFGMMNWIYNWYDPQGKLSVAQLTDNISKLFLSGLASQPEADAVVTNQSPGREHMSVWRVPTSESRT